METIRRYRTQVDSSGSSSIVRVLPSARQRPFLPFSVEPKKYGYGIVFKEKGLFSDKWYYRGLDGRVSVRTGEPDWVNKPGDPGELAEGVKRIYILLPSGARAVQAIKTAQFAAVEFAKKSKGSGCKFASALWDGSSWVSGCVRNIFFFFKTPNPAITAAWGYTSAMGVVWGPVTVVSSLKALKKAKRIGDVAGARLARMGVAKGVLETGSGAVMGGIRTLSLVQLSTTSKAMAVASNVLGIASTVGFVAIFAIYVARFSRTLAKAVPLLRELKKTLGGDGKGFDILEKMATLSDDERKKCGRVIEFDPNSDQLKKMVTEKVELTDKERALLTIDDKDFVEREIKQIKELDADERDNLKIRYLKEISHAKMVKEVEYRRIVGGTSLVMIKEYRGKTFSTPELSLNAKEAIVKKAQRELRVKIVEHSLLLFALLIGIASFILTTVFSAGTVAIVGYAMMLVMNVIMTGADTKALIDSSRGLKKLSTKEKVTIAAMMVLTIGIMATSAFFTGGGSLLIVALIIGIMMVGIQGTGLAYAWHKDRDNKRKEKELADSHDYGVLVHDPSLTGRIDFADDSTDLGFGDLMGAPRTIVPVMPASKKVRGRNKPRYPHIDGVCLL